jgi:hypothetical protein
MLDEPTIGEIVRDIQQDVRKLVEDQQKNVTREVYDLHREAQDRRLTALEEKDKERKRLVASAFVLPLLVLLVAYALGVRA